MSSPFSGDPDGDIYQAALAGNACWVCGSVVHMPDREGVCPRDKGVDILVPNVDVYLLREQRDGLIECGETGEWVEGLLNILDAMLDIAEGYNHTYQQHEDGGEA